MTGCKISYDNNNAGDTIGFIAAFADVPVLIKMGRAMDLEMKQQVNANKATE